MLYILTEGGDGIGIGHITRCSALYEKALEYKLESKFIVFGKNINKILKKYNHEIREWKDVTYLSALITKDDYVIIDSYLASIEIYELVSKLAKRVVYIDDNMRLNYPKGIVVNPSLYGNELNYPKKEEVEYLLGKDYIILRKEFEEKKKDFKKKKQEIEKILITLGGTDIRNLIPKLLKILRNIDEDFKIKVIVRDSYSNLKEILEEKTLNTKLLYNLEASNMEKEMEESDLVISACGQTIYELLAVGTSFIPIVIIENQSNNAVGLKNLKIFDKILNYTEIDTKFNLNLKNKKTIEIKNGANKILSILIGEKNV